MNMMLHGVKDTDFERCHGDTLTKDCYRRELTGSVACSVKPLLAMFHGSEARESRIVGAQIKDEGGRITDKDGRASEFAGVEPEFADRLVYVRVIKPTGSARWAQSARRVCGQPFGPFQGRRPYSTSPTKPIESPVSSGASDGNDIRTRATTAASFLLILCSRARRQGFPPSSALRILAARRSAA